MVQFWLMDLPKMKHSRLDDRIGLPIEGKLKDELFKAKQEHDFHPTEWIRQLIYENWPKAKEKLDKG